MTGGTPLAKPHALTGSMTAGLILLTAVMVPRAIVAARMVVPARDTFRYVSAAEQFQTKPFLETVRSIDSHPLYPFSYAMVKQALNPLFDIRGIDEAHRWVLAGQLWNLVCTIAFFTSAFCVGTRLWSRDAALTGCVAVAMLPRMVNYSVDILTDSLHAALWMSSFHAMVIGWQTKRGWAFAGAGALAGLAYLTRAEAFLLPLAFLCSALMTQLVSTWRWPWTRMATAVLLFYSGWLPLFGSYVSTIGSWSPRNSVNAMVGLPTVAEARIPEPTVLAQIDPASMPAPPAGTGISAVPPPVLERVNLVPREFINPDGYERLPFMAAIVRLVWEIGQETRLWLLVAFSLTFVLTWGRSTRWPEGLLPLFSLLGALAMLILLQMKAGYIAGRYLMPVMPLLGMYTMSGWHHVLAMVNRLPRCHWERLWSEEVLQQRRKTAFASITAVVAFAACVPIWCKPLHRYRAGHLAAAHWLEQRTHPGEPVFDSTQFSAFFANRSRWVPGDQFPIPFPFRYAVIDPSMVYRGNSATFRVIAAVNEHGRVAATFPREEGSKRIGVYVFEVPSTITAGLERNRRQ